MNDNAMLVQSMLASCLGFFIGLEIIKILGLQNSIVGLLILLVMSSPIIIHGVIFLVKIKKNKKIKGGF